MGRSRVGRQRQSASASHCPGRPTGGRSRSRNGPEDNVAVRLLDTTAPGRSLRSAMVVARFFDRRRRVHHQPGQHDRHAGRHQGSGAAGEKYTAPDAVELRITEFSASTGKVCARHGSVAVQGLGAASWQDVLWTNSSGSTLIVDISPGHGPARDVVDHPGDPAGRWRPARRPDHVTPRAPAEPGRSRLVIRNVRAGPAGTPRPGPLPCLLPRPRRQLAWTAGVSDT